MSPVPGPPTPAPSLPPTSMGNWIETFSNSQAPGNSYGNSISLDNSDAPSKYAVAIGEPLSGSSLGAVLVWSTSLATSQWTQVGQTVSGTVSDGSFGISVALLGNTLLAGASNEGKN